MNSSLIDWPTLLRIGLGSMGLKPNDFWALTPAEFLLMAGLEPGSSAAMTRKELDALRARFPDKSGEDT